MSEALSMLTEFNFVSIFVRLLLSVIFGGVIGLERGIKGRPAGMRTYMLVCMGSALVMCTGVYITELYGLSDPARMGAQVVSGIGFLGAGTIIVTRNQQVKGLTTAAGLWASACMGLAIGMGFYWGAILGTFFIFLATTIMHRLDSFFMSRARVMEVYIELLEGHSLSEFLDFIREQQFTVTQLQVISGRQEGVRGVAAILSLHLPHQQVHGEVMDTLRGSECLQYIEDVYRSIKNE